MSEKTAPEGGDVDLFGDPWTPPKDPRGRKRHKRSAQLAETIANLRGTGATKEDIGQFVGLSVKTLEKYYSRELDEGPALAQAALDRVMYQKALAGNVSAARYMRERYRDGGASIAVQRVKSRAAGRTVEDEGGEAPAQPVAKLGKKAERQAVALQVAAAGGRAAPPPPPKLVVRNS